MVTPTKRITDFPVVPHPINTDIMYLIRGTGIGSDRKMEIEGIRRLAHAAIVVDIGGNGDYDNIPDAVTALNALGGGLLKVRDGNYTLPAAGTAGIALNNIHLMADGLAVVIKAGQAYANGVVELQNDSVLDGVTVDRNGFDVTEVYMCNSTDAVCNAVKNNGVGVGDVNPIIYLGQSIRSRVKYNWLDAVGNTTLSAIGTEYMGVGNVTDVIVKYNRIDGGKHGIYFGHVATTMFGVLININTVKNTNSYGIYVGTTNNYVKVINNYCDNCVNGIGIYSPSGIQNTDCSFNQIDNATGIRMQIGYVNNLICKGNQLDDDTYGTSLSITSITGNEIIEGNSWNVTYDTYITGSSSSVQTTDIVVPAGKYKVNCSGAVEASSNGVFIDIGRVGDLWKCVTGGNDHVSSMQIIETRSASTTYRVYTTTSGTTVYRHSIVIERIK